MNNTVRTPQFGMEPAEAISSIKHGPAIKAPDQIVGKRKLGVKATVEKVPFAFDLASGSIMDFAGLFFDSLVSASLQCNQLQSDVGTYSAAVCVCCFATDEKDCSWSQPRPFN
jgi:hypothetical protein